MPAAIINSVPTTAGGYNLTDSTDFTTLVSGAGNGVKCLFTNGTIVLKNDTGSSMDFTILVAPIPSLQAAGLAAPNLVKTVAAGKILLIPISQIFQRSDGYVTIECTAAGKVLVLT